MDICVEDGKIVYDVEIVNQEANMKGTERYRNASPAEVRLLIRRGIIDFPTPGMCAGYAQANLIILSSEYADDFEKYTRKNPFACPVLEILRGGPETKVMAKDCSILTDIPRYRIYKNGEFACEETDVSSYWHTGDVGFLIGCSFSFEEALMRSGIEIRHITQGCNVPMYKAYGLPTVGVGPFSGPTVCSMRPMTPENAETARRITSAMPNVHGAPCHIGDPGEIGIKDISKPDYGDSVEIRKGEIPVFWPCGVTPQAAVENARPPLAVTHAPGHMLITDILNSELNGFLESRKAR